MGRYDDMLDLPRPESGRHPRMPRAERAKQFMPFAALKGYGDEISERETLWEPRPEPAEEDLAALDEALHRLAERIRAGEKPEAEALVFTPKEPGAAVGQIRRVTGRARSLSPDTRTLRVGEETLSLEDIVSLRCSGGAR